MRRSRAPAHNVPRQRSTDSTGLLIAIMLLACLTPLVIALSTASGQEQPAASSSAPASVPRGWIEPAPTTAAKPNGSPAASAPTAPLRFASPTKSLVGCQAAACPTSLRPRSLTVR